MTESPATVDLEAPGYPGVAIDTAPAPAVVVRVDGLSKRFAAVRSLGELLRRPGRAAPIVALDDVAFEAARGECVGVLGPNGAGKSTLFRVLSTLVIPDAGAATVCGLDVVEDAAAVRPLVGVAGADERSLYWRLPADENLRLYAAFRGLHGAARSVAVREALAIVGLSDVGSRLVGRFSSGMRQRLIIARALLGAPPVLLLDEPTRSLDPISARGLRAFIREELVGARGCTVLLATHAADEAFDICDRVVILHRGRVAAAGPAAQLARRHGGGGALLWVQTASLQRALAAVATQPGYAAEAAGETDAAGWSALRVSLPDGPERLAALVERLVTDGVRVARAEPRQLSLAELLERVAPAVIAPSVPADEVRRRRSG